MAVKVACWPGRRVAAVVEVQVPVVPVAWQVGPVARDPAGAVWVSVMPTAVRVVFPLLVATKE